MLKFISLFILSNIVFSTAYSSSYDGSLELEHRYFFDSADNEALSDNQTSARLQMEFFKDWNNGDDQLVFEPFIRLDSQDDERTHSDIRQLIWSRFGKNFEISAGIGRVFWGVTESQHLVDIVNQSDNVENIDSEDKLGQPMVRYSHFNKYGTLDAFILPYFRESRFPGTDNRLNTGLNINTDNPVYEDNAAEKHFDYALRYSNTVGDWGIGFSVFDGTSRDADLSRFIDVQSLSTTPYYAQITQWGADIQLTTDAWLIKLEAINRSFDDDYYQDYSAATIGAEYTLVGILGSVYDLGVLTEYSWDERDELATSPFQNDLFVGARFVLNDISNSEILFGISNDLDNSDSRAMFIEGATRIGSTVTLNVELRHFASKTPNDPLFLFKDDSFIQVGVEYFFD